MPKFIYRYSAQVTCANKEVKDVSGTASFETDYAGTDNDYLLKCQILIDRFRAREATGAHSVKLLEKELIHREETA